jgi:hypothetical protein
MNRNLGATAHNLSDAPKTYGLFYQWGRKDPFPGSCEGSAGWPSGGFDPGFDGLGTGGTTLTGTNANGIISSIKNPQHFYLGGSVNNWLPAIDDNLWNDQTTNQKTIYDPCPSGWRVPRFLNNTNDENHSPWKGYTSTDTEDKWGSWDLSSNALTGGMIFGSTTNAQYPGAGYRGYGKGASGDAGAVGHLWCATSQNSGNVIILRYANTGQSALHTSPVRASGFSVRCVQE